MPSPWPVQRPNGRTPAFLFLVGAEPRSTAIDRLLWRIVCRRWSYIGLWMALVGACPFAGAAFAMALGVEDTGTTMLVVVCVATLFMVALIQVAHSRARWLRWHAWASRMWRNGITTRERWGLS